MPNPTDPAAGLRDALAAVAEALAVPAGDATPEQRQAWRELLPVRAILVSGTVEAILRADAPVADHVRYLRERIAAGGAL